LRGHERGLYIWRKLRNSVIKGNIIYIDGHFLPYYGMYPIIKGWHGVRRIPMKGSYNFIGVDDKFTPWIFLIRFSSEDLLQKIPEIVEKAKKIGHEIGLSDEEIEDLIVIFDREGYSAELYRFLDGKDRKNKKRRAIFISWAKYYGYSKEKGKGKIYIKREGVVIRMRNREALIRVPNVLNKLKNQDWQNFEVEWKGTPGTRNFIYQTVETDQSDKVKIRDVAPGAKTDPGGAIRPKMRMRREFE